MSLHDKEVIDNEVLFLQKLGFVVEPFFEGSLVHNIFKGDKLVGYILSDEDGDLVTRIDSEDVKASYLCGGINNVIIREIVFTRDIIDDYEIIALRNIHNSEEPSDYLDYSINTSIKNDLGYSVKFEKNKISCGKSEINQYIEINGEWLKGRHSMVSFILEKFRSICPDLIDYYVETYGNDSKRKQLK